MSTDLIPLEFFDNEPRINSMVASKKLGVQHRQFMEHLKTYYKDLTGVGLIVWAKNDKGKKFVTLSLDQMFILISCFRNTEKARDYKMEFVVLYSKYRKGALFKYFADLPDTEIVDEIIKNENGEYAQCQVIRNTKL